MAAVLSVLPLFFGFVLDAMIGDPYNMPHPVRAIGALIHAMEAFVRKHFGAAHSPHSAGRSHLKAGGVFLAVVCAAGSAAVPWLMLYLCYRIHIAVGIAAESLLCFTLIAAKSLKDETMKVYRALKDGDTGAARQAVSMVVGRDTSVLDRDGIIRAAVETIAENTSDGVTAPLMYMAAGGAVGGFFYKAVNTMDSMIGYRNEKYREIGWFAARLDDVLNYLPSRMTALFMMGSAFLLRMDVKNAWRIWRRDRRKHDSPNSAQTESVCAGALDVRLAGDAVYFGEVHHKPYLGDAIRPVEPEDIIRANRLMQVTSILVWAGCMLVRACIAAVLIRYG